MRGGYGKEREREFMKENEKEKEADVFLRGLEDGNTRWDRKIGEKKRGFINKNVKDENGPFIILSRIDSS